jgi:hypothetical protein
MDSRKKRIEELSHKLIVNQDRKISRIYTPIGVTKSNTRWKLTARLAGLIIPSLSMITWTPCDEERSGTPERISREISGPTNQLSVHSLWNRNKADSYRRRWAVREPLTELRPLLSRRVPSRLRLSETVPSGLVCHTKRFARHAIAIAFQAEEQIPKNRPCGHPWAYGVEAIKQFLTAEFQYLAIECLGKVSGICNFSANIEQKWIQIKEIRETFWS